MTKEQILAILIAIWEEGAEDLFPLTDLETILSVIEAQGNLAYEYIRKYLLTLASAEIVDDKWQEGNGLAEFVDGMNLRIIMYLVAHIDDENLREEVVEYETWNGERILNTEETRCKSLNFLETHDTYVYHAIVDSSTCEECLLLNGCEFKKEDAVVGYNLPPMHPNCRCWIDES